jgi:ABC-type methionine transport system ATPase subunit
MLSMDFADMYDFDDVTRHGDVSCVGLEHFATKLPLLVSTGQQQLAAIARPGV